MTHGRPGCFLAHTIKGCGTPISGHKDNCGGLTTRAQMADWQTHGVVAEGEEWQPFATVHDPTPSWPGRLLRLRPAPV